MERLSSPMTIVWLIYFSFAELSSLLPSKASSCVLISEEANTENYSGNYACASMHEAIFRLIRYVWDSASHDNVIAFGTILIALFTFVLYRSTTKLWLAGEKQIEIATKAANFAEDALITSERPWIKVTAHPCGPLTYDQDKAPRINFLFRLENVGKTPAKNVGLHVKVLPGMGNLNIRTEQKAFADGSRKDNFILTSTIFPGDSFSYDMGIGIDRAELERYWAAINIPDIEISFFTPVILGFADYISTVGGRYHQTGFIFDLHRRSLENPKSRLVFDAKAGDVAMADLILSVSIFGTGYVD